MTHTMNRRRLLAGATATTACMTAWLAAPALVRAQPQALKIAVLLPRSGYLAQAGQSCHRGAQIAGKVLSDFGYRVELTHIDIESSPEISRTQAEKVINEGAHCIVGAFDSACTLAIAQVCEQRQVPLAINIAAAPPITEQGYKFLVRNFPTGGMLGTNGLKLIKDVLDATKFTGQSAAFLHANHTFRAAEPTRLEALFPRAGLPFQLAESIAYDPRAQDLSVEVTKIRALNPDLVLTVTRASDAIKLCPDMVRQRFEPKGIISPGSPGLYDEEFYQALGPLSDYPIYNLPWADPKAPLSQALEAAFKPAYANFRFPVECFNVGFTFEARLAAADRFKRARTTNGPALMEAIRATDIGSHVMIGPPIKFDDKGQNVGIPSAAVQSRNRTPTVVLPATAATMAPVLPMPGWQCRS